MVGGFSTFQARSAFAEVGKVLGLSEREVRKFTEHFPWSFGGGWVPDAPTPGGGDRLIEMLRASPENRDLPIDDEPYKTALQVAGFLDGMPRHPKMHPCGLVLSRQPMQELTPTFVANKGCPTTHMDMDAVEEVNRPGPAFVPEKGGIRVPITRMKGLTERVADKIVEERKRGEFSSLGDFFHRVHPSGEELESMIRSGAFDEFGDKRTRQFWQAQHLLRTFDPASGSGQGWLIPPADPAGLPQLPVQEPTRRERLLAETELFGFTVSGHPLELFDNIAWDTYCPVNRLGEHVGETVLTCGLVVEQRVHHQITGEPMKFLTLADWSGMVETELFSRTYKTYGLATVRYPVLEIEAQVEPFENGRGHSLRALAARKPRTRV